MPMKLKVLLQSSKEGLLFKEIVTTFSFLISFFAYVFFLWLICEKCPCFL